MRRRPFARQEHGLVPLLDGALDVEVEAELRGERQHEVRRRQPPVVDEDLAEKPSAVALQGQSLLELDVRDEALLDEERPERLPGLAPAGAVALTARGGLLRLLLRDRRRDRQRGHPAARGQDLAEQASLVALHAQRGLELLFRDHAALDEQAPERRTTRV